MLETDRRRRRGAHPRSRLSALHRPVDLRQYLLGKWLAVAIAVSVVVLGPGLLLNIFSLLAIPGASVADFLSGLAALLTLTGLLCLSGGWVVLAVSSLAGRGGGALQVATLEGAMSDPAPGLAASGLTKWFGQVLARVGLADQADRPVRRLSHGMRQRLKVAQALAHRPEVLVLDEPLSGMDPVNRLEADFRYLVQ